MPALSEQSPLSSEQGESLDVARQKARELRELLSTVPRSRQEAAEWLPSTEELRCLLDQWLPEKEFFCDSPESCESSGSHQRRCSADDWRTYALSLAELMNTLASSSDIEPRHAYAAGLLSHLDCARYPHENNPVNLLDAHPFPLLEQLSRKNISKEILIALLENPSHLDLEPSTPLSLALLACRTLLDSRTQSTEMVWPESTPQEWRDLLHRLR